MAPTCYLSFIIIVHLRSLCRGWLRRLFSFSAWRSSTSTLPKPPPAKETIAQLVSIIWRAKPWQITEHPVLIVSMIIYHCCLFNIQFPIAGLVITGGGGDGAGTSIETFIETFPADADCSIPPFPGEGNLSSPDYQPFIHSPPKGDGPTPSLSLTTEANLWLVGEGGPRPLASLGSMVKRTGKTTTH